MIEAEVQRRATFTAGLLSSLGARNPVLDVGAYRGAVGEALPAGFEYYGLDLKEDKRKGVAPLDFNEKRPFPFADGSMSTVLCLDVFEHVLYPEWLLSECSRVLSDGGLALFSFPNETGMKGLAESFVHGSKHPRTWSEEKDGGFYHLWFFTTSIAREFLYDWRVEQEIPYWGRIASRIPLADLYPGTASSVFFACRKKPS